MYHALKEQDKTVRIIFFQGEGHGPVEPEEISTESEKISTARHKGISEWAQADHIEEALLAEYYWYETRIGVSKIGA